MEMTIIAWIADIEGYMISDRTKPALAENQMIPEDEGQLDNRLRTTYRQHICRQRYIKAYR
jgi:hypothetical protein